MPQSASSSAGVVPKCRCGNGEMRLFTSHTKSNPNRKFWGCPKWTEGYGCGAFLWKDRVSVEHISGSDAMAGNRGHVHIDMDKLSFCFEELKREIQLQNRLLQLNMEGKNGKKQLVGAQTMYLQMIFYVLLITVVLICVGLAL